MRIPDVPAESWSETPSFQRQRHPGLQMGGGGAVVGAAVGLGLKVTCAPKWFDSRISYNQNDETLKSKLAQVPEQSEFTHSIYLVAAGHL